MKLTFVLLIFISTECLAASTDVCEFLKLPNCHGVTRQLRRSSFPTSPSSTTAANLNPANVSLDRGIGLDIMYQPKNSLLFGLSSGTGKMGGALISGSIENSFFGNRAPELDEEMADRMVNDKQYRNKKFTFAIAAKLFSQKNYGLDAGLILKRHPLIKKINPGFGLSGRLWKFSFGASSYKDDYFVDLTKFSPIGATQTYSELSGKKSIQDTYTVTTYAMGLRVWNFAFDYGLIKSKPDFYKDETVITIYSSSFNYKNLLLNLAVRNESSNTYDNIDERLKVKQPSNIYSGVQYSINDHILFGVHYNYFLLNEMSISTTLFI